MAVIKNQKTGMWEVRTYYKDWTGERKQKTKRGFAKKSEALEWERNFKLKEDQSISMTFGSFVEIYLKDLESRIKKNTFLTKKHIIETKILPYFGRRKLDEMRTADVIQWQNEMMKLTKDNGELFSLTYLKTIHNQLSAILNHAVNFYGLKDNVACKAGNMGKEESKEMEFWTQDEFQVFLECVADKEMSYYVFEILYWTGIREGELLALTPEDFNFQKKTLRINKSYQRREGEDVITDPKTPKSNRTIVMPDFLADEMEDFISRMYGIEKNERIFTISKSYLHHEMDRGAKLAGVPNINAHHGNALDLSKFEDESFDITLVLGPMYHMYTKEDKQKVLAEAIRVTKSKGHILVAYCMNEATVIRYAFLKGRIWDCVEKHMLTDDFKCISEEKDVFEMVRLEDIDELNAGFNDVERVKIISVDGATNYMRECVDAMDEKTFDMYMKYHLTICERMDLIGAADHSLDILEKR